MRGRVIAIANQKGGVGKTTTAFNLGYELSQRGFKVMLVDFDPQGNLTKATGAAKTNIDELKYTIATAIKNVIDGDGVAIVHTEIMPNLNIIPCNIEMANLKIYMNMAIAREYLLNSIVEPLRDEFDYIIIDTAPTLDIDLVNAFAACDDVIITASADTFSTSGINALTKIFNTTRNVINSKLRLAGILVTSVDDRTKFTKTMIEIIEKVWGRELVFNTKIPQTIKIKESVASNLPIALYDKNCKAAIAYEKFTDEYLSRI